MGCVLFDNKQEEAVSVCIHYTDCNIMINSQHYPDREEIYEIQDFDDH